MKGDFTRLTFRPERHYTSVRMQQGRLQLDSDWNEQADIQAHLYRTQVVDLIGSESGAPTSENDPADPNKAYKDSFKIRVTDDKTDLVIEPGRFYVNGTLCELEDTSIEFKVTPSNQVKLNSLILDGRKFEQGQWVKILSIPPQILKINGDVNTQTLELPLSSSVSSGGELHRALTYKTQSDYPNPEPPVNGVNLVYLDVWQRHITTIEDPELREPALNIPDTTTRTKTVWQLKLQPLNRTFIEENTSGQTQTNLLNRLKNLSVESLQNSFNDFLTEKIPSEQQGDTTTRFAALLDAVVPSSPSSWKPQFEAILQSLLNVPQTTLKTDLTDLLATLQPSDVDFGQLLSKVILTPDQEANLKIFFQALLAKAVPSNTRQLTPSLTDLLTKTTSTQEKKNNLRQPFNEFLSKIITLTPTEKTQLQSWFEELQAAPTSATSEEKTAWTTKFNQLLPKIDSLASKRSAFQLKLEALLDTAIASDQILKKLESYEKDETIAGDLANPKWSSLANDAWRSFSQKLQKRKPLMNACAKLCSASGGSTSSDSQYRRLENQLYRVEIHKSGKVGDDQSGAATFKWSRDNGSIVSLIEKAENFTKGIVTIRKSAQDAWATSKSGQWIEFLDEERELKGKPGQLARLNRVSGNVIEFDSASLVGEKIQNPTKVRRWDHMTKDNSILTRTAWIELEAGIKVQFDSSYEYQTGDYWLIPARATINDIEWTTDGAEDINKRKPLAQPAQGIGHDYCLLAVVKVDNGAFLPLAEEQDYRFIFPSLVNAFDKRGGVITGNLEVKETLTTKNLKVTGEFANNQFKAAIFTVTKDPTSSTPTLYGSVQVGATDNPKRVEFAPAAAEVFAFTGNSKVGIGTTDFTSRLGVLGNVALGDAAFLKSTPLPSNGLIVQGATGLGTASPKNQLDVLGAVAIGQDFAGTKIAPANGLLVKGKVAIGLEAPAADVQLHVKGKVAIDIDSPAADAKLHVDGTIQATKFKGDGSELTGVVKTEGNTEWNGDLTVKGNTFLASNADTTVGIGLRNAVTHAKLEVQVNSNEAQKPALSITNTATGSNDKNLLWVRNDGKVGIGIKDNIEEKLHINGSLKVVKDVKCDRLMINASDLPAEIPAGADARLYVKGDLLVEKKIFAKEVAAPLVQAAGFNQISSRVLKDQVNDLSSQEAEEILQRLNPVKFIYNEDITQRLCAGFIAEDMPDLLTSSDKQTVKILDIVAILTKAVKDQQYELEQLQEKLNALEARNLEHPTAISRTHNSQGSTVAPTRVPRLYKLNRRNQWGLYRRFKNFIRRLLNRT